MPTKIRYPVQKAFRFYDDEDEKINEMAKTLKISQVAVVSKALKLLELELAQSITANK